MANIDDKVQAIRQAAKGLDVRSTIADGIEAINGEVESTTQRQTTLESNMNTLADNLNAAESSRVTSENTRVSNEQSRSTAETNRVTEFDLMKSAYEAATKEHTVVELTDARHDNINNVDFNDIGDRLDSHSSQLNEKAKQIDLNTTNTTVSQKADKTEVRYRTEKFSQADMTEEFLQQIAGATPINSVPGNNSVANNKLSVAVSNFLTSGKSTIDNIVIGTISGAGVDAVSSTRARTDYIKVNTGTVIDFTDYTNIKYYVYFYLGTSFVAYVPSAWLSSKYVVPQQYDGYNIRLLIGYKNDAVLTNADIETIKSLLSIKLTYTANDIADNTLISDFIRSGISYVNNIQVGALNASTGAFNPLLTSYVTEFYKFKAGTKIKINNTNYRFYIGKYDVNTKAFVVASAWYTDEILIFNDIYAKIVIGRKDAQNVTTIDYANVLNNMITIDTNNIEQITKLKVMTMNVWVFKDNYNLHTNDFIQAWRNHFAEHNADIIGMQEYAILVNNQAGTSVVDSILGNSYSVYDNLSLGAATQQAIASKYKLFDFTNVYIGESRSFIKMYTVVNGKKLCIANAHPHPSDATLRAAERQVILNSLANEERFIMLGDFNDEDFSDFTAKGYKLANRGWFGDFVTWDDVGHSTPMCIDNIITSSNITIDKVAKGSNVTSDHYSLIADVTIH